MFRTAHGGHPRFMTQAQAAGGRHLMLLDAASLYFRAFYGVKQPLLAPDGTPTNAVRGFLDMMSTLLSRFRATDMVACIDTDWRPAWRVALVPSYKTHRLAAPNASVFGPGRRRWWAAPRRARPSRPGWPSRSRSSSRRWPPSASPPSASSTRPTT